ncbi:MAG: hypothetical protein JST30_07905 [Armatimonadetes bacterium]|nr:hypothetical protein [Armatimonadota bacterium]
MPDKIPLTYTFGNHMHWVDMEWLWGYRVLPGSVADMLRYCHETGAKGCVNFDGIGYEKLAAEAPEALRALCEAVQDGVVEPVGCSYGQPYGLFHGGESNVRQRVYGVRTVMRLLGVRPKTFWEEEFDFFPQLPQMLSGVGMSGASLYFQWTWHTPEVPFEDGPVVWWEGVDGTRLLTATRNRMNLHQWPEDFQILLDELAEDPRDAPRRGSGAAPPPTPSSCSGHEPSPAHEEGAPEPLILQWLELMPSPDWMCRSEIMLPKLLGLKDDRFDVTFATLGEYLDGVRPAAGEVPVRRYGLEDVWHGMTLGKNGDRHVRKSAALERRILTSEAAWAILGLFGRPYKPWDVYPVWELEECWRMLLAAQHHDNHECEGLCGHVAEAQMGYVETALDTNDPVGHLGARLPAGATGLTFNGLARPVPRTGQAPPVPAWGYSVDFGPSGPERAAWTTEGDAAVFRSGEFECAVSRKTGGLLRLRRGEHALTFEDGAWPHFSWGENGEARVAQGLYRPMEHNGPGNELFVMFGSQGDFGVWYLPRPESGSLEVVVSVEPGSDLMPGDPMTIDPGYAGGVKCRWRPPFPVHKVFADSPYSVAEVGKGSSGRRKYPEGDWMTSPQWFEQVEGAFTSSSFVDFVDENGDGLLVSHDGSQQWFRTDEGFENVLLVRDPWDGDEAVLESRAAYRLTLHGPLVDSERIRLGWLLSGRQDHARDDHPLQKRPRVASGLADRPIPSDFSFCQVSTPNVVATALYRESEDPSGRGLERYAGRGMGYPYVLRLVEFDGLGTTVVLNVAGPVEGAFKTDLMGEIQEELRPERGDDRLLSSDADGLSRFGIEAARLTFTMRPHEIATLYLDIVPGRKQVRDLDSKREVWATVHR